MSILFAILLGILQGVFEFLPVSSSALTALSGNLMVVDGVPAVGVSALLHTGSLIAAAVMLRSSWRKLFHACGRILRDLAVNIRTSYRNVRFGQNGSPVRILGNTEKTLAAMIAAVSLPLVYLVLGKDHWHVYFAILAGQRYKIFV